MDASTLVKRILIWAVCCIAAILLAVAALYWRLLVIPRKSRAQRVASAAETAALRREAPLTATEALECSRAIEGIVSACSNLQYEVMQELFDGISNKVARYGYPQIENLLAPLDKSLFEKFWLPDLKSLDFTTESDFDRYIKTNVAVIKILGCTKIANGLCDSRLCEYDLIVFKNIGRFLEKFTEDGNEQLARAVKTHLDEWKEYLASGQSVTRMQLKQELQHFLKLPRRQSEDMGMKTETDWIKRYRDFALKFHEQYYGIVPKWLDEEFPLPHEGKGGNVESVEK